MEQIAYLHDVHLRYGCFCNVGACRRHLRLDPEDVLKHYEDSCKVRLWKSQFVGAYEICGRRDTKKNRR
ncbi:unnamed protein product [Allacma fusca]|uniref:Uncharacterized protein n=1 Tax=Allacma fusca TaxID=39272 RepID=A0A8J2PIE4_9HEXA|nr:unnamed protein product [Allacma fusca]